MVQSGDLRPVFRHFESLNCFGIEVHKGLNCGSVKGRKIMDAVNETG